MYSQFRFLCRGPFHYSPRTFFSKSSSTEMSRVSLKTPLTNLPKLIDLGKTYDNKMVSSKLENGLQIASVDKFYPTCAIGLFVNVGSKYENSELYGQSKFIEKMAFKASKETTTFSIAQAIERMGAHINTTSLRENMIFTIEGLKRNSRDMVHLLSDSIMNPAFYSYEINNVKYEFQTILTEHEKNHTESVLYDDIHEAAYGMIGIGLPMIGSRESIDKINKETLHQFYSKYFVPNRMCLVGVGLKHDELKDCAIEYFDKFKSKQVEEPEKSMYIGNDMRVHDKDINKDTHICIAFKSCNWKSKDLIPVCILNSLMGGGNSFSIGGPGKGMYSRIYQNILNQHYFVNSCNAYNSIHNDTGIFGIKGTCDPNNTNGFIEAIIYELKNMTNPSALDKESFNRAKNAVISSILLNMENHTIELEDIGRQILTYDKRINLNQIINKIKNTTEEELIGVALKILASKPTIVMKGNCLGSHKYSEIVRELRR